MYKSNNQNEPSRTANGRVPDKGLLTLDSFCEYLAIGKTKARELLHNPANGFTVRIGNRLYAHKGKVDEWLLKQIL